MNGCKAGGVCAGGKERWFEIHVGDEEGKEESEEGGGWRDAEKVG